MEPNHRAIPTHSEDSKDEISLESRKYFHVNDLPVELLREIFVTLKADWDGHYSSDGCTVAHVITKICHFWRFVALNEPRLWATLIIGSEGGSGEGRLQRFSDCLERSKGVHLELMVNFTRQPSAQFRRRVKEIATPHLNRCTSLHLIDCLPNDWIPLPNELKSLRDVVLCLDLAFPQPLHQILDLGLPTRLRYLKLSTLSLHIPAFALNSVMEHLSVSLNHRNISIVANLLRDVEPLKTLEFELVTFPSVDLSAIFPHSFPQLENLILRGGGRVSSPIVAPRLKHLYYQAPRSLHHSSLDTINSDILKGLISLEVRTYNLPRSNPLRDCLVHCHALECLGAYVVMDDGIRLLESLLSTARPPSPDLLHLSAYHCPNLQRMMFSIYLGPDPQAIKCISNRTLELLALRPRLSKVEIKIRIGTGAAPELNLSPLTKDLPEAFPARVVVWGPDVTCIFSDPPTDPPTFLNHMNGYPHTLLV